MNAVSMLRTIGVKRAIQAATLALALAWPAVGSAQGAAGSDVRDDSPVLPSERILNELNEE